MKTDFKNTKKFKRKKFAVSKIREWTVHHFGSFTSQVYRIQFLHGTWKNTNELFRVDNIEFNYSSWISAHPIASYLPRTLRHPPLSLRQLTLSVRRTSLLHCDFTQQSHMLSENMILWLAVSESVGFDNVHVIS